jgi:hypothetical protein
MIIFAFRLGLPTQCLRRLPNRVGFTQSLSNKMLCILFGFFYALPLIQASLIRVFA